MDMGSAAGQAKVKVRTVINVVEGHAKNASKAVKAEHFWKDLSHSGKTALGEHAVLLAGVAAATLVGHVAASVFAGKHQQKLAQREQTAEITR